MKSIEELNARERRLYERVLKEYGKCVEDMVRAFFDQDSTEMLEEKLRVLKEVNEGKPVGKIDGFYDILENYPEDGETWDL